jgi:hypothetical protein
MSRSSVARLTEQASLPLSRAPARPPRASVIASAWSHLASLKRASDLGLYLVGDTGIEPVTSSV